MKARIPVKPITLLGLMNVIVSKLLLLIVVYFFLPHFQGSSDSAGVGQSRWFQFLPGFVSDSDTLAFYSMNVPETIPETRTTPHPPTELRQGGPKEAEETRKKLLLMASVIVFDIVLSTGLTLSLAKSWFCGIWPWIVFRLVLAGGLLASSFAIIIENVTMRAGKDPQWDLSNVLSILATIIFANVYIVYSYYWNKTRSSTGPPLLPMRTSHIGGNTRSVHPMYSSIGQGSEETTITMELDDVVSLSQQEQREAEEIRDHKASLAQKYSSFWENQSPGFLAKHDPNATL